jgi:predicted DNA-binding ribbon-helix-helix protein
MSQLSNPKGLEGDSRDRLRALAYRGERVAGRFVLEGEDAHYLKVIAAERNMTVDALVKQFAIEGLWRARTFKEM